jgi:hypothetical protein
MARRKKEPELKVEEVETTEEQPLTDVSDSPEIISESDLNNIEDLDKTEVEASIEENQSIELIEEEKCEPTKKMNSENLSQKSIEDKNNTQKVSPVTMKTNPSEVKLRESKSEPKAKKAKNTQQPTASSPKESKPKAIKVQPKTLQGKDNGLRSTLGLFHRT